MAKSFLVVSVLIISSIFLATATNDGLNVEKRSFTDLGCMGVYDKAKFARLDRVCEECYQLYRDSDVHTQCRSNCFKNTIFTSCVDTLLLKKDQESLEKMVEIIYG